MPLIPASAHVGRVSLQVSDLDRSLAFYQGIIGFEPVVRTEEAGRRVARLGISGSNAWLLELREKRGVRPVPPRGLLGLYHFAVLLPDRADLGRFIVHAANAGAELASADHLVSEALYLTDPDGLQIEVYRDLPQAEWQHASGQVRMATLPLDFDPIVASADGTQWSGVPRGTVIGHVHLYVGDLDVARAFYVTALGFEPTFSRIPGALFVAAGGYHHHVGLNVWAAGSPIATDDDARMLFWELALPDAAAVQAAVERLTGAGYAVDTTGDDPTATDPWNITVRLVASR